MSVSPRLALRLLLLASALAGLSLARGSAQTSIPVSPSITLSPRNASPSTPRDVRLDHLPAQSQATIVTIDPSGGERVLQQAIGSDGSALVRLSPPGGSWASGLYRVVVGLDGHRAISATFAADDGGPHLYVLPDRPPSDPPYSPFSTFMFGGAGLPPSTELKLVVRLANARGDRVFSVTTDADGMFASYLWPQQLPLPFFEAGFYRVSLPDLNLATAFAVRERPVGAALTVEESVDEQDTLPLHLQRYPPSRYIWAIYADLAGNPLGELLLGPVDLGGAQDVLAHIVDLPSGRYLLATPYDWGETVFTVDKPDPTATPTATPSPSATPTPTVTPTPTPTRKPRPTTTRKPRPTPRPSPTPRKRVCKAHHHAKGCKSRPKP